MPTRQTIDPMALKFSSHYHFTGSLVYQMEGFQGSLLNLENFYPPIFFKSRTDIIQKQDICSLYTMNGSFLISKISYAVYMYSS